MKNILGTVSFLLFKLVVFAYLVFNIYTGLKILITGYIPNTTAIGITYLNVALWMGFIFHNFQLEFVDEDDNDET